MKNKVLMICYFYPPLEDVGCKRSVAFAKYLKKHSWVPFVLSVKNPDKTYCKVGTDVPSDGIPTFYARSVFNVYWFFGKINGLLSRVLSLFGIQLKRNYLHDVFSIPDIFWGWIPGAVLYCYKIIKKHNIDLIYVSCTPYSSAIVGMILKKMTGKPLVVDSRDTFTNLHNPFTNFQNPFFANDKLYMEIPTMRRKINFLIEKKIIDSSDAYIVTTEEILQGYLLSHDNSNGKIHKIYNGFDHVLMPDKNHDKYEKFTIVYAGNMYLEAISATSLFAALATLIKDKKITNENFQFLYFGGCSERVLSLSREHDVEDIVHINKGIPYCELLQILQKSHLQLLRIIKPMISTKLFEGIALDIPFLATIPEGEVADIINEYCLSSYLVHDDSAQTISNKILEAMQHYKEGNVKPNDVERFLSEFSREKMTYKLEDVFNKVLHQ